uniref:NADH-ubiquinone oxidoreductase chain 2 n=1 Tax=Staurois latopalmatus TaxID=240406 RepID=D6BL66_9NEOB|nr:NADH dehydrogenase subunit 2 [Staurois latopalmatus]
MNLPVTFFGGGIVIGTLVTISSNHWFMAWMGLEINTLAFMPMMTYTPHPRAIEAATKYFLTQASASALLLFSALLNAFHNGEWKINSMMEMTTIPLSIALMMKLGLAPVHFWLPDVLQGITLSTGLILSTWQKIAPMTLLLQITDSMNLTLLSLMGLLSILIGGWGGIGQTQMRKIMAFSSIGHMGWMITVLKFSPPLTLYNFAIYMLMTTALFCALITTNSEKMAQISTAWPKSPALMTTTMLTLLSTAGLPPFTGFSPKLLIMMELIKQDAILMSASMTLISLLALFFYLRLAYITILTLTPNPLNSKTSWQPTPLTNPLTSTTMTHSLMLLPATPTLLTFM